MTRTLARTATLLTLLGLLAACETVEGFGEDVEAAGQAIDEEAEEAQN
ncbi:entericidin A/B family lipoprotein [Rhodobacterales bacterium HKCCE3408]|nr:entericidin A/B family lipoprotein [Rhodobacterales bacterium HKCCE3408]